MPYATLTQLVDPLTVVLWCQVTTKPHCSRHTLNSWAAPGETDHQNVARVHQTHCLRSLLWQLHMQHFKWPTTGVMSKRMRKEACMKDKR